MAITKSDILDYVKKTPENTNVNVLAPMLDAFEAGDNKEEVEVKVTVNGTYTPDTGKVYKKVVVDVPISNEGIYLITETEPTSGTDFTAVTTHTAASMNGSGVLYITDEENTWYMYGYYYSFDNVGLTANTIVDDEPYGVILTKDDETNTYEWSFLATSGS